MESFEQDKKTKVKEFFRDRIFIIPSLVTSISICLGMHSIYLFFNKGIEYSLVCICISAFIDGIDGRIARYLNSESEFGKTLDSLADFLSFSMAPTLLIYFYKFNNWISFGWSCCILFVLCAAFRLARFSSDESSKESFMGIPAPGAGLLAFFPLAIEKSFGIALHPIYFALMLVFISFGMIGKFRTIAINRLKINKKINHIVFGLSASLIVFAATYLWATAFIIGLIYIIYITYSIFRDEN